MQRLVYVVISVVAILAVVIVLANINVDNKTRLFVVVLAGAVFGLVYGVVNVKKVKEKNKTP